MAKANGKTVKKPVVAKKRGGCTGKGFCLASSAVRHLNWGGPPP
jgi:hypothetical protein